MNHITLKYQEHYQNLQGQGNITTQIGKGIYVKNSSLVHRTCNWNCSEKNLWEDFFFPRPTTDTILKRNLLKLPYIVKGCYEPITHVLSI